MINYISREESIKLYDGVLRDYDAETMRRLCLEDLFFLLVVGCRRVDLNKGWVYERVREVEGSPDGNLDLWAREHCKSSIITFGLTIQDILKDADVTIGIFSHTRPIAKGFLSQIKREFEGNQFLKDLFPDVLYQNPYKESPRWSLDDGIIVKRKGNPKESTVEAWGIVDGQPTSKHYNILVYDDVVTKESVSTPEMIAKVTESFELSLNLAGKDCRKRYIGTRYHQNDTYRTIISRGTARPRIYPATDDGTINGNPVLMSKEELANRLRDFGSYVFSCQMLQNPMADASMGFKNEWLSFYYNLNNFEGWNIYLLVDPAGEKKKSNDYTVMWVVGLAPDNNYYVIDGIRDRLNLTERTAKLFELVRKWQPKVVGYEKYGMQADVEHIEYVKEHENYRFNIVELGGSLPKHDRIRKLVPIFENGRFYLPKKLLYMTNDGRVVDLIDNFIKEEFDSFPVCSHDDMLDCLARIMDADLGAVFPNRTSNLALDFLKINKNNEYDPLNKNNTTGGHSPEIKETKSWKDLIRVG